jgi:branched-chain amino acid transport system substrate-binding protein
MRRLSPPATLVAFLALLAPSIAAAAGAGVPGVTSSQITIGSSGPLTGPSAPGAGVLRGAEAYFKYVNDRGGVYGRTIKLVYLDDAADPTRTQQNVRRLVSRDKVFALFSIVGTEGNLAVRDLLNADAVPQVFAGSGAATFGRDHVAYPWTIGYSPTYSGEGRAYARHVLATRPNAKVAVLYQSDSTGRALLEGFRSGLGAKARKLIVQTASYDPASSNVESQVGALEASGANTFCIFAFGKFAIQAFVYAAKLGWHPQIYVDDAASSATIMRLTPQSTAEGSISMLWAKDPSTPLFAKDPGVKLAASIIRKFMPGGNTKDAFLVAGMAEAFTFVDALRNAGPDLTRQGLMTALTHLDERANPFLAPGISVRTTPNRRFPIEQVQLQRWHRTHWVPFGPLAAATP